MTEAKTVPVMSMVMMAAAVVCVAVMFFGMMIYAKKKLKTGLKPFFVGCAVFVLFALILESIMHNIVLNATPAGETIKNNIWLYALYGGLAAGIFEETGRFLAFKTVMKKSADRRDSVAYGMGHGGVEALLVLGISFIGSIVISVMINSGMSEMLYQGVTDQAAIESIDAQIKSLTGTAPIMYLASIIERVIAISHHIAASVLVYAAAKRGKAWLYPAAILIHAVCDGAAVVIASTGINIFIIEGILAVMSAAVVLFAVKVYKGMKEEVSTADGQEAEVDA